MRILPVDYSEMYCSSLSLLVRLFLVSLEFTVITRMFSTLFCNHSVIESVVVSPKYRPYSDFQSPVCT